MGFITLTPLRSMLRKCQTWGRQSIISLSPAAEGAQFNLLISLLVEANTNF